MIAAAPMHRHEPFRYRNAGELLKKADALGVSLPYQDSIAPLFATADILGQTVPNRIAVQPMEGFDSSPTGAPGELTFRRYRRYSEGGSGLIWFEACSVSASGCTNPRQLLITQEALSDFQRLVEMTRRVARSRFGASHDPYLVLQLTHSGRFSKRGDRLKSKVAYFNPHFDRSPNDVEIYRDEELAEIRDEFINAAMLARQAGFDMVDIKACHGYLLNELLSAFTREDSSYGGEFSCRTRLLLEIVGEIRKTTPQLALAVRLNATDGIPYPYGFGVDTSDAAQPDLVEPLRVQQLLIDAGCVLLNISAGNPYYVPHIGRPFDRPAKGAKCPDIHPLRSVSSLIHWAAVFQKAHPSLPVVGTGYSWLRHFWPNVGAAVIAQKDASFVGLGRNAFAYPDAPLDLMNTGRLDSAKCCTACSCCTDLMRNNQVIGCVIRDRPIYKQAYGNIRQ